MDKGDYKPDMILKAMRVLFLVAVEGIGSSANMYCERRQISHMQ